MDFVAYTGTERHRKNEKPGSLGKSYISQTNSALLYVDICSSALLQQCPAPSLCLIKLVRHLSNIGTLGGGTTLFPHWTRNTGVPYITGAAPLRYLRRQASLPSEMAWSKLTLPGGALSPKSCLAVPFALA